jgi:Tfp pilus assembly protein PilV
MRKDLNEKQKLYIAQVRVPFLLAVVSVLGLASCQDRNYEKLVEACKQIQLGMSEDQVLQKMGPPSKSKVIEREGQKFKSLLYAAPPLAATAPYISINAQSLRVEKVICDDHYELVAPSGR